MFSKGRPVFQLPQVHAASLIEQTYRTSNQDERRIRKRTQNGSALHTLGLKRKAGQGTRVEKEQFHRGSE